MIPLRVALVGNPNAGKTTLFNALTGLRQKVGNYPGVTVECREGRMEAGGRELLLLDLPGIYSLSARSPEESIAASVVRGEVPEPPDVLLAVADATNLERHLYLASQLLGLGRPVVLALTMSDLARDRHVVVDAEALGRELGVRVVPVAAPRGEGLEALARALLEARTPAPLPPALSADLGASPDPREAIRARYGWIRGVCARAVDRRIQTADTLTDRLDAVLTHRVLGLACFLGLMFLVFLAIFSWAEVPMDLIGEGISGLKGLAARGFAAAGLAGGPLESLVLDGAIEGVGAVLVFLPQILILFFFLALLEDSGYMARAAFLMDRIMRGVGLHGKSFIPLLSSFACAVPGVMATRTIEDRRDRLATILVAPLMSCSARLPVYTLMIAAFIPPARAAGTMLAMYVLGMAAAFAVAWLLKKSLLKGPPPPFVMELPSYRMPALRGVLLSMWERSSEFLKRAGTVILALSLVLWFLAHYPRAAGGGDPAVEASWAGRIGHALEPVVRPLGFDWRLGVGLVTSFAAREVIVTTLEQVFPEGDLVPQLRAAYAPVVGVSVMVFFVLACQCMSTVAVVRRETGGWRWPLFMVGYMTALAYLASLAVFQVGSRL